MPEALTRETVATRRIVMLMFDDVEVLDFAGPYEVFTTASRVHGRQGRAGPPPFTVQTVSRNGRAVRARAGLVCQVDAALADAPAADWLLVPGGVVDGPLACADTLAWVAAQADTGAGGGLGVHGGLHPGGSGRAGGRRGHDTLGRRARPAPQNTPPCRCARICAGWTADP